MKRLLQIGAVLLGIAGLLCLGVFFFKGGGNGKLTWDDPIVRKSLMTFAYKIYGDPSAENGRFFLSKIVFRNDGTGPVRDLSISYQIPDYISWTTPETHAEIPAGQTVVELYYPQLPSKVTQLTSQTNATLETKIRWSDNSGDPKEQILRSNIILRGVNEIEYTDLPRDEIMTFYDVFNTAEFAIAMVTPNDPVVKEYSAEITKRIGGTLAGVDQSEEQITRLMKATYDYMCETGMRYASAEGVPSTMGDVTTYVQTVRMPRDVILTNQGLCVELAILWASIMEHLGCNASVVFLEGHAFTVVWIGQPGGSYIPIECTAITPMAVQSLIKAVGLTAEARVVPFEKAVQMALIEMNSLRENNRPYTFYGVKAYQSQGMHSPELPAVDIEKIKEILSQRSSHNASAYAQNAGNGTQGTTEASAVRQGYFRWVGANNMISVDVPEAWTRMENSPVPGMIFSAQDMQTSVAVNAFYYPTLSTSAEAMQTAKRGVARVNGGTVRVISQQQKGDLTVYTGTTSYRNGSYQWVGVFGPSQGRGVIGLFVGAVKGQFERNQPVIQDIISSAHLATGGENNNEGGNE
jgi:hypothetical protein